jgi:protein tyrosine phosphatase (PTP) superfamily phosphohydrolase (DUF442 family)
MADRIKFNHAITVGGQPSREDLRQLADEGFKAIVNLRPQKMINSSILTPRLTESAKSRGV